MDDISPVCHQSGILSIDLHLIPNADFYEVKDLFFGASSGSEPSLFFTNYLFGLGFKPSQDDFYHDFAQVTDKADGSVFLAVLKEALLGNVKISDGLWGRPFSCSPDLVTDLC